MSNTKEELIERGALNVLNKILEYGNDYTSEWLKFIEHEEIKNAKKIIFSVCRGDENNNPLDTKRYTITMETFQIINHPNVNVDLCAICIAGIMEEIQEKGIRLFIGKLDTNLIIKAEEVSKCSTMEDIIMILRLMPHGFLIQILDLKLLLLAQL